MRLKVLLMPVGGTGGFTAVVPSLPGCVTEGDSFEAALANAHEAATGWLRAAADRSIERPVGDEGVVVAEIVVEAAALATAGA